MIKKNKIDRETFKKFMLEIIEQEHQYDDLAGVLENVADDSSIIFCPYDLSLKILAKAMHDIGNWISYWYYELDKGTDYIHGCVTANDEPIRLETLDDLYDIITK